jgi:hypothetical protein
MKLEDLDRILASETQIEASSALERDVMARIRDEIANDHRIPFPWIPFAAATLILTALALRFYPADSVLRAADLLSHTIVDWMVDPSYVLLQNALLWALASLVGTLLIIWFSLRLAGSSR